MEQQQTQIRVLPKIEDLYADKEQMSALNDLNKILNAEPHPSWLQPHPIAKKKIETENGKMEVPCVYVTVQRMEWLLTNIFIVWNLEILTVQLIANSVCVTVRLHYLNPVTNEKCFSDGVGAAPIQTDSAAGAVEFQRMKSNAIQIGAPAAESFAFKDAAEKLGKIFGKDLNRSDKVFYDNIYSKFVNAEAKQKSIDTAGLAVKGAKGALDKLDILKAKRTAK